MTPAEKTSALKLYFCPFKTSGAAGKKKKKFSKRTNFFGTHVAFSSAYLI
jgi:hypothetical protein